MKELFISEINSSFLSINMTRTILFFQLFFISLLYGQESITGTIINSETNVPLVNTNIYILDSSIGTVSNEDGNFALTIPETLKDKTLTFSSMGFESQEIKISQLKTLKDLLIKLRPNDIHLDEIVIIADKTAKLNGIKVIRKALDNYHNNYPVQPYIAKGFIRHTEKTKNEYKWLVEGAFQMYDPGYDKKEKGKINIVETRKSLDNRIVDTAYTIRTYLRDANKSSFRKNYNIAKNYKTNSPMDINKVFAFYDNHYTSGYSKKSGLLEKLLFTDINKIRYYNKKNASFNKKTLEQYNFKIDTIFRNREEKIYKVKFFKPNEKQNELDVGYLYIQDENFSIIEMEYSVLLANSHHRRKAAGQKTLYSTTLKFKEYENKMYPFYLSHKTFKINNLHSIIHKKSSNNNEKYNVGYLTHQEILFSEITTVKEQISQMNSNFEFWNDNLFNKRKYNASFWDNYNILLESKEELNLIRDLEQKMSLKNQFLIEK